MTGVEWRERREARCGPHFHARFTSREENGSRGTPRFLLKRGESGGADRPRILRYEVDVEALELGSWRRRHLEWWPGHAGEARACDALPSRKAFCHLSGGCFADFETTSSTKVIRSGLPAWTELHCLVDSLPEDKVARPGYFVGGGPRKDRAAHIEVGSTRWAVVLERIQFGTYRPEEIDIDATNETFHDSMHDVAF